MHTHQHHVQQAAPLQSITCAAKQATRAAGNRRRHSNMCIRNNGSTHISTMCSRQPHSSASPAQHTCMAATCTARDEGIIVRIQEARMAEGQHVQQAAPLQRITCAANAWQATCALRAKNGNECGNVRQVQAAQLVQHTASGIALRCAGMTCVIPGEMMQAGPYATMYRKDRGIMQQCTAALGGQCSSTQQCQVISTCCWLN
jgi:hypothetical protein